MAAAALAQFKGLAADGAVSDSGSVNSSTSSAKRKRDLSDSDNQIMVDAAETADGSDVDSKGLQSNGGSTRDDTPAAATTTTAGNRDEKRLIRDYFEVLSSFDKADSPILKRPLPEPSPLEEPYAKRQKSNGSPNPRIPTSIADKVALDVYIMLDDLVEDVATVVNLELASLTAASTKTEMVAKPDDDAKAADAAKQRAIAHINNFSRKAHELYRRETAYPKSGPLKKKGSTNEDGEAILTVFGNTPQPRQLFSSLPHRVPAKRRNGEVGTIDEGGRDSIEEIVREDSDLDMGGNIMFTRLFPGSTSGKAGRVLTFGELFPSPRNLPPLQPPKAPKSSTKSTTLGFYHPELEDKSKYRSGSYFSQHITVGQWLDYSNATPSSQIKTKQRERAQSLAGHKPSTSELEMSEMESLFRGAFSSFAPSKDDSAALVPAAQVSHMWWQRVGHRVFQRMVDAEFAVEDDVAITDALGATSITDDAGSGPVLDEEALLKTIEEWDDSLVDPSLEDVMGQKPDTDKDVNDVLQDVSDLIITLASYQRNRNLTLPTSQDRFSADPVNADMLRNGTLAQQPSEEEMVTYQALKAQLALIIQGLPPYAVARLNSDRLAELNISTKIEVRSEEYRGVMEEDEAVLRARQAAAQAQAAASTPQRTPGHRAGSVSTHAYGQQFGAPSRSPMPATAGFYQTPGRATPAQHRQPSLAQGQQFRATANGYGGYTPAASKGQQPQFRGQPQGVAMYPGTPGGQAAVPAHMSPQRVVSQPQPGAYGSPAVPAASGPQQFRYQAGGYGAAGYPQQQQQAAGQPVPQPGVPQQQQRLGQQVAYTPSPANGTAQAGQQPPQRPGQVPPQMASPQPRAQVPYSAGNPGQMGQVTPGQQQLQARASYGGMPAQMQGMPPGAGQRHFSASAQGGSTPSGPGGRANLGPVGYHTVMDQPQQQRLMEQARARASAHERTLGFTDKISQGGMGQMSGLAGIGPGGNVDMAKLAAARANMPGGAGPRVTQPQQQQQRGFQPGVPSPSPVPPSVSPAPSGGFQRSA